MAPQVPPPREAARAVLRRGWSPVPVPLKFKRPVLEAWEQLRLTDDDLPLHFPGGPQNLGVLLGEPSGGLADVDLDAAEALRLADAFLPATNCSFGRRSAPRSHKLFVAEGTLATTKFRDPTAKRGDARAMLVELRSTGCQTLVPPSVHPSGEDVEWAGDGEPAWVPADALRAAVARLAAAALLARRWPAEGARQDAALALSGGLLRAGWAEEDVAEFVGAVAEAAGDEEAAKRAEAARFTARALAANKPATGWPALARLVGDPAVGKVREWLGLRSGRGQQTNENADEAGGSEVAGGDAEGDDGASPSRGREPAQATVLLALAEEAGLEAFRDEQGEPYVSFPVAGHRETWPLRAKAVRHYLARLFYLKRGRAPGSQALQDALQVLDGQARFAGAEHPVAVRLAEHGGTLYLDLGNKAWQVVAISPAGWKLLPPERCPVRFRRPRGALALPEPRRGGSVGDLRRLLNLAEEDDFLLVAGWLLGCLWPRGPRAILQLLGEQGSAKSTQARLLRSLVDPNAVPLRTQPRDEGDLLIAAANGALVALDNLSELPRWLSDALCRLATGGGLSKRELYTDLDEVLLDARRPVLLTAIGEVATASDLLDRCVTVVLPTIAPEHRQTEAEVEALADRLRPGILGALLDAAAAGLRNLPATRLARAPRLADFATWVEAASPALGWEPGEFLAALEANRRAADAVAIEALPVGPALLAFMEPRADWQGTATALLTELNARVGEEVRKDREWPKRANRLAGQLRRLAPNLRAVGLWVGWGREAGTGRRQVILTKNKEAWDRHQRHERHNDRRTDPSPDDPASSASSHHRHATVTDEPEEPAQAGESPAERDGRDAGDGPFAPPFQGHLVGQEPGPGDGRPCAVPATCCLCGGAATGRRALLLPRLHSRERPDRGRDRDRRRPDSMSRLVRCRRCGALFLPDRVVATLRSWRLCARCRGPERPGGGALAADGGAALPCSPEGAP